jgi:hypothetical protein
MFKARAACADILEWFNDYAVVGSLASGCQIRSPGA